MIIEYLRPNNMDEAISLLQRQAPITLPLGGGDALSKYQEEPVSVVDLQSLGLNKILHENGKIEIGATATLTEIDSFLHNDVFATVLRIQAGKNQRNTSTIAGMVKVSHGRSPFLTLLLAMDAQLQWQPGEKMISLGNWLPIRHDWHEAVLMSKVIIPDIAIRFDSVARTPKDRPIVAVAMARWPSGRMRVAVGGFGPIPVLALDGTDRDDVEQAVDQAFAYSNDQWASSSYRREVGKKLASRLAFDIRQAEEESVK